MKIKKSWILSLLLVTCTLEAQMLPTVPVYTYTGVAYAGNSNLLTYSDSVMGTWSMQYDSLNRLKSGTASTGSYQGLTLTWDYDSFGNRLSQIPSGTSNVLVPGAITQAYDGNNHILGSSNGITSQSYDGAGNLTFDGLNFYAYDAENRVCVSYSRITASITQYLYDADGNRVAKLNATATNSFNPNALTCAMVAPGTVQATYLLGQSGEQITELDGSGNWKHTNVYAAGQLLATYDQEGSQQLLHFNIGDSLGTKLIQTTATGMVETTCQSLPYGDGLSCMGKGQDATENHYTGKERDAESGLDYFGARYYGSSMGRFMSPDPVKITPGRMANPQQLNLYSYVANNPLRFIDPDGETLQISGDVNEAQKQLCVLVGGDCSRVSYNGDTQTITVDLNGIDLSKNEGASLLNDVVGSANTYSLTLGSQMLTAGGLRSVTNDDPVNLDNRPDERFRRGKDAMNLPPKGVDDAIGIDPNSRPLREEFNGLLVPLSSTIFHELAEAFAKVDGGEQYVMGHNQIGAHNEAVEREHVLRSQRPNMKLEGRAGSQLIRDPKPPKP